MGLGVAAVAAGGAFVKLERAGRDAINEIDRLGVTDIVTDAQRTQVAGANDDLDAMKTGAYALTASLAAALAPTEGFTSRVVHLELFLSKTIGALDSGALTIDGWKTAALGALTPAILWVDALNAIAQATGINDEMVGELTANMHRNADAYALSAVEVHADTEEKRKSLAVSTDAKKLTDEVAVSNAKSTEAYKKHAEAVKAAAAAYKEQLDAMRALGETGTKADEDLLDAEEKLRASYEETLVDIERKKNAALVAARKAGAGEEELASIVEMAASSAEAADRKFLREREAAHRSMADARIGVERGITDADREEVAKRRETAEEEKKKRRDDALEYKQNWADAISSIADSLGSLANVFADMHAERASEAQDELKRLRKRHAASLKFVNAEGVTKEEYLKAEIARQKKAARIAFRLQQGTALVGIGVNTAMAVIKGFAEFGPPPSPIGIAAAAAAGLAGAASAAQVMAQKPPEFAQGGQIVIAAHDGEGIANRRAMADPGFRSQLDAANVGQGTGGQRQATYVFLNDRLLMTMYGRMRRLAGEV